MKNWNLRTLILLRAFCMIWIPLLTSFYAVRPIQWLLLIGNGAVLILKSRLDTGIGEQMDERAQSIMDKLNRQLENGLTALAVFAVIMMAILGSYSAGYEVEMRAWLVPCALILAWLIVIAHVIRGIAFCVLDRRDAAC